MFKKINTVIIGLVFALSGVTHGGEFGNNIVSGWRKKLNSPATRSISSCDALVTALKTAGTSIIPDAVIDAMGVNADIKLFVTNGSDGLDGVISNLTYLTKADGATLTTAVNSFFDKVQSASALNGKLPGGITSFKSKWINKIKAVASKV